MCACPAPSPASAVVKKVVAPAPSPPPVVVPKKEVVVLSSPPPSPLPAFSKKPLNLTQVQIAAWMAMGAAEGR